MRGEWLEYLSPESKLLVESLTPQYFWSSSAYSQKQPSRERERARAHGPQEAAFVCLRSARTEEIWWRPTEDLRVKDWSQTACMQIWLKVLLLKATLGSAIERALTIPVPLASSFLRGTSKI